MPTKTSHGNLKASESGDYLPASEADESKFDLVRPNNRVAREAAEREAAVQR